MEARRKLRTAWQASDPARKDAESVEGMSRAKSFAMISLFFSILSLGAYVFSVNRNAVSGYSMRIAESRMANLADEAQKLKIREAELRSLYGIEGMSSELGMVPISGKALLDDSNSVAYKR